MIPTERAEFSAIVDREPLKLPGDARIIVWTIVNYEVWDISRPMARQVIPAPTGQVLLPDVPNWSWHEYGMRVGAWRFFDLYTKLGIRPTLALNARVYQFGFYQAAIATVVVCSILLAEPPRRLRLRFPPRRSPSRAPSRVRP